MALNVKNKIWLGTMFLFLLLVLTGGAGLYYTARLKQDAKEVLKDNYESLAYCHAMQQQLDSLALKSNAISTFAEALQKEEKNTTEPGEADAATTLRKQFDQLQAGDTAPIHILQMKQQLQHILQLNMQAISNKNAHASVTAEDALGVIIVLTGIVFLVAFTFSVNFPSVVTNPIRQLSAAIKEISNKNYRYRIHLDNKDEFGNLANAFNDMAERMEYFESSNLNKLLFEKSRAEAVINSLKDASIGIDKNNIILFANYQALQLLGMKAADVVGKPVNEVSARNDLFSFLTDKENIGTPFKIVIDNRENYFTKEVMEVVQEDANNRVIVVKNITSFKELDVAKTNFIATISHELKTPLASSDFSLKLLEDERVGQLSGEQKELIQHLKEDNQRMLRILSELLNMAQVEAGRIQLNRQIVHPLNIVNNAVQAVATTAKEKGIIIHISGNESLPMVYADAEKTVWVLNNFLTNAIKYSQQGSNIEVSVKQQQDRIVFAVADHGAGIAAEYLPKIFDRFFQVPGSKEKGTGLGLAISKDFIEAQGGSIWVESELGNGAVFSCSLAVA